MLRFLKVIVLVTTIAANGCGPSDPAPSTSATSAQHSEGELSWAKEISDTFLVAAKNRQSRVASLLLSAEMTESHRGPGDFNAATYLSNTFANWQLDSWSYKSERLSPDKNEASFQGVLKSREYGEGEFVLRVMKEKDTGLWRVNFLSDGDWKKIAPKK